MSYRAAHSVGVMGMPLHVVHPGMPGINATIATWGLNATAATYPTADLAIYIPFRLPVVAVALKLSISTEAAASGNMDIGIYDTAGVRLVSTGTTAMSGTFTEQVVDVTDTTLSAGLYYLAVTIDNTTASINRWSPAAPIAASCGVLTEQLGAGAALPATATWAVPQTLAYVPVINAWLEPTTT